MRLDELLAEAEPTAEVPGDYGAASLRADWDRAFVRYLQGRLSDSQLARGADAPELRESVECECDPQSALATVLLELATAEILEPICSAVARELRARLKDAPPAEFRGGVPRAAGKALTA